MIHSTSGEMHLLRIEYDKAVKMKPSNKITISYTFLAQNSNYTQVKMKLGLHNHLSDLSKNGKYCRRLTYGYHSIDSMSHWERSVHVILAHKRKSVNDFSQDHGG